jgi:hypothetical protein
MSGTGTIHDTASEHFDREIEFAEGEEYAIVLAAYYGKNLYYMAKDGEEALEISDRNGEFSHVIIDRDGDHVDKDWLRNKHG